MYKKLAKVKINQILTKCSFKKKRFNLFLKTKSTEVQFLKVTVDL